MPYILALECASDSCSVALLNSSGIVEKITDSPKRHNELLLPMVDALLSEAQLAVSDIDAIAFGCGPGSFTGIRIAASVAQGLAFAGEKPVIPISSLAALAQAAYGKLNCSEVLTAVDARMGEIYWAHYRLDNKKIMRLIGDESLCLPSKVPDIFDSKSVQVYDLLAVGSGYCYQADFSFNTSSVNWAPEISASAKEIVKLAAVAYEAGRLLPAEQAIPVYLRETVNWKKLPGR